MAADEPQNDQSQGVPDSNGIQMPGGMNIPGMPADAQVNPEMAGKVMALFGRIDQAMDDLNVPSRDRMQVMQNLMEAIAADLMTRLGGKMSEEERNQLVTMAEGMDMKNPDLQSVAGFFRGRFTQEELMEDLAGATEGVLADFMKEMGRTS